TLVICSDHGFHWGKNRPQTTESGTRTHAATLWHRKYGIVALEGAGIKAGVRGTGSVFDIAPTLLALLDLPPGQRMTGKVLDWAFTSPPQTGEPVDYQKLVGNWRTEETAAARSRGGDELKKLQALGYLGGSSGNAPTNERANAGITPGALNNLGSRLMSRGDLEGAKAAFERSIRADPGYPGSYRNLATVLVKLGKYDEAVKDFFKAFDRGMMKPEDASVDFALALKQKGQTTTALQVLAEARKRRPASYTLALNDGTMLGQSGKLEPALAAFRRACELEPSSAIAWRNRGVAALELGHKTEAEQALSKSLELNPDQPDLQRMVVHPQH
ncbi:MAG TPA: tetratricopeptide repeat protein, partial [Thermoanaerobaculia bacterium]|nr:tetratricopeptide repeat protein [Thermoanaerobaculia bacterium]